MGNDLKIASGTSYNNPLQERRHDENVDSVFSFRTAIGSFTEAAQAKPH